MKKVFALLLTLALIATLSVASFAADVEGLNTTDNKTATGTLTVNYESDIDETAVYSVDVTWTNMEVTYNAGALGWSPEDHEYNVVNDAEWTDATAIVTVTNHSNAVVDAEVTVAPVAGVSFAVTYDVETIDSAVDTEFEDAPEMVCTITASNAEGSALADDATSAVTVTITAAE